ncbi:GAD-like domain-containing protein [Pseudoalteromonas galatheae]|nr:GAD-like domain-containing protein [Pseudoalteromonas galatheae]
MEAIQPTDEQTQYYQGTLPNNLLEYWKEYGFCGWGKAVYGW